MKKVFYSKEIIMYDVTVISLLDFDFLKLYVCIFITPAIVGCMAMHGKQCCDTGAESDVSECLVILVTVMLPAILAWHSVCCVLGQLT